MQLEGKRILLTGAAGGMGQLMASALAARGARLILVDQNAAGLQQLMTSLPATDKPHVAVPANLCSAAERNNVLEACRQTGGIDVLINAAGISDYAMFAQQAAARIELTAQLNLVVPMLLCQLLLPLLQDQPEAAIVNIGSTFGSIGHPGFTTYCASKFGLRGFSEALRRELADTHVQVFYIAPRATRTDMNSDAVVRLNKELGNTMDEPQLVVDSLLHMLTRKSGGDYFLGWPEKLFVRLNGLIPALVDSALYKQLPVIKRLCK
jgi:short-subunit dehydrogenase